MPNTLTAPELFKHMHRQCAIPLAGELTVHTDASDYFALEQGHIVLLEGRGFQIRGCAREGRFGLDDEVKYWVKRATDLSDGSRKILKIPFFEKFDAHIAGITYECYRSPMKESRILSLVGDHPNFMHGYTLSDEKGTNIRVLDIIPGPSLADYIVNVSIDHERYFYEIFPTVLDNYIECVEAIALLHANMEKHGDIRRDHIFIDRETSRYRWIDFDYNYRHRESMFGYDLFGLGNVLAYITGKGDAIVQDIKRDRPDVFSTLWGEDLNMVFKNRVLNLRKLFPYIPEALNDVLLHFSQGANYHYDTTGQLLDDLRPVQNALIRISPEDQ